jgi:hypothetical protein
VEELNESLPVKDLQSTKDRNVSFLKYNLLENLSPAVPCLLADEVEEVKPGISPSLVGCFAEDLDQEWVTHVSADIGVVPY